jgi:hypothetical protein
METTTLSKKTTYKVLYTFTHTLSHPSKMPCHGYNLPAHYCKVGSLLRKIMNSVCSKCYALKGRYVFPNVLEAMEKRFKALENPSWVEAMTALIDKKEKSGFFRWHDSGDVQDLSHLLKIAEIAKNLPHITFWLPTREYAIVQKYMANHEKPKNLTIRLSALMLDKEGPTAFAKRLGLCTSGVSTDEGFTCPSSKQDGKCGDCRACWNPSVFNVNYKVH